MALRGTVLLSLALLLLAAGFIWFEFRQQDKAGREQSELYAQTLASQVGQSIGQVDLTLLGLLQSKAGQAENAPISSLNTLLALSLAKMPAVRSFSLLDAQGLVLASSSPNNVGRRISLRQLQRPSQAQPAGLGRPLAGRDLFDLKNLDLGAPAQADLPAPPKLPNAGVVGPSMVTLSLAQQTSQGMRFWVAVLRPEYFDRLLDQLVKERGQHAALLSLEGELIAASREVKREASRLAGLQMAFKELLSNREHGSFSTSSGGASAGGLTGMESAGSFQRVHDQPLVVLLELPKSIVWERMNGYAQAVTLITAAGLTLMLGLGTIAWRALGVYEQAKRELVTAHESLASKEREQSLLIQNVQELMFHTDANGLLQFINHVDFLGNKSANSCLGQPFEALIDARDKVKARGLFRRSTGFMNLPVILRLDTANGRQRVLEVVVTPIKSNDGIKSADGSSDMTGELSGFVGFALDVTEREDARQRLQAQLDFTARLIDVCPIPIFAKDRALRFVMVNQAWSDMTGVDKNLALGRKLSELRPASLADAVELQDQSLLAQGGSEHMEIRERERDYLTHRAVFTDASGAIAGLLGSAIDISRFVEAERQIGEARDAAERANNIKTEFVANMSHELRTPLQSIIGFSELGVSRSGQNARLQDMFARIHSSGQRMLELVNNLLDLSRLESTVGHLVLTEQDLAPLVKAVVDEHAGAADKRSIKLKLQLADHPLFAAVDAGRLQQALRNVLDNALRLAPATSQITISANQDGAQICISVHDLGPGIPTGELESIFSPFAQSSQTKEGEGGTGLGLAVCRRIMVAHGGGVSAHNHAQGGAIFELRLPIS
ncbi:PAS domain-containing protein [Paucibacter sp. B2R-40]|uniref:cache domain-containing sensor histidine kinase n=1 Tax=Paucibacter sp. B2R-40 TaxID=2893554 RepID=UPI0021E3B327|nr:ATP-binding protein [Paucibacter sp. B2R-40]MCV2355434.1 PAS domain-containing protein [Paucibacter sp. B2R-40]